jgi:hypothetical protein
MKPLRLIVVGTLANNPYAGMAWMNMQIAVGLLRLGHDVYYFETTSQWPYDPVRRAHVNDSEYAVGYLARVAESFGMKGRWAYRRSYGDKGWFGMERTEAEALLARSDAVFNVAGATKFAEEDLKVGRLIYFGTDPVYDEIAVAQGEKKWLLEEHDDFVTYGEKIGDPDCPIPPFPRLRARTRQPILLDLWEGQAPSGKAFTTVANWHQTGHDIAFRGETYFWSKDREFMKFIDLPAKIASPVEIALGRSDLDPEVRSLLETKGWRLADAHSLTLDPWKYRDYLLASRGEFTVAKDQNVRLRSGWFSERSACYLAAGRPVITQDTGFGDLLPTGEGLFAFNTLEEIVAAFEAIESDYERHARAARKIAEEYFRAETVLTRLLQALGFS